MTQKELRDTMLSLLHAHVGRPIVMANQTVPEEEYPYMFYQPVQPYIPIGGVNIIRETVPGTGEFARDILTRREEQAEGTFSFTACSRNRDTPDGKILGDDEALELCERAHSFFLHAGLQILQDAGLVVVEVMAVLPRSALEVDEIDRRYGFDVRLRYLRVDVRRDGAIEGGAIKHLKEG